MQRTPSKGRRRKEGQDGVWGIASGGEDGEGELERFWKVRR